MTILILLICFISIYLVLENSSFTASSKKENLIITVLLFGCLLVAITELLSALQQLNFKGLFISWGLITLINCRYLYPKRTVIVNRISLLKVEYSKIWLTLSLYEKTLVAFVALLLAMIGIQGIVYPPNNWDSMSYHLARIASWVSHETVYHYPTHVLRQIYQPPFAEYVIMHFNLLSKSDYFANSVQLIFLFLTIISVLLITESLGINRKTRLLAAVLVVTIPMVILQASSTQNDIVIAFFVLTSYYFGLKAIKAPVLKNYFLAGLTLGLGLLTKGTGYLYFAPIMLFWGFAALKRLFITKNYRYISYFIVTLLVFLVINSGFYYRNYQLNHSILGIGKKESVQYANQKITPALLLSSIVKNSGLHMGLKHVHGLAHVANDAIYKLHAVTGISINNPDVNFANSKFTTNDLPSDEDYAPNFLHFLLITTSFIIAFKQIRRHKNRQLLALWGIVILQMVLFCGYLKWQPYATRLHTPIFLLAVPLLCYAIDTSNMLRKICSVYVPLLMVYSLMIVTSNRQRPFDKHLFNSRYTKIFTARDDVKDDYTIVKGILSTSKYKNVGLVTNSDAWTYPLFYDCFSKNINPIYLNVKNFTQAIHPTIHGKMDCIVTTDINKRSVDYKGERYYNITPGNKLLYLYIRN